MTESRVIDLIELDLSIGELRQIFSKITRKGQDECWDWTGNLARGYGQVNIKGRSILVHRLIYRILVGPIPSDRILCHWCNNKRCCNPDHLYLGTYQTNNIDAVHMGKSGVKLSVEKVKMIRGYWETGQYSQIQLGELFGVSNTSIHKIVKKKTWK